MAVSETMADAAENPRAVAGDNRPPRDEVLKDSYGSLIGDIDAVAKKADALPKEFATDEDIEAATKIVKESRELAKTAEGNRSEENEPHLKAQRETNAFFRVLTDRLDRIKTVLTDRTTAFQRAQEAAERRRIAAEHEKAQEEARQKAQEAADANAGSVSREIAEQEASEAAERAERLARQATASSADLTRTRTGAGTVSTTGKWVGKVDDYSKVDLNKLRSVFSTAEIDKAVNAFARKNKDMVAVKGVTFFKETKASFR